MERKDKSEKTRVSKKVINRKLNQWLRNELGITLLGEILSATFGPITVTPLASTHLEITVPDQEALETFLAPFKAKN